MAVCVLLNVVPLYFAVEIIGINAVMVFVTRRQERLSAELLSMIERRKGEGA